LLSRLGQEEPACASTKKGSVAIAYQEAGSGFPLLLIGRRRIELEDGRLATMPFNPIEEFKGEYRCIFADLAQRIGGGVLGPA